MNTMKLFKLLGIVAVGTCLTSNAYAVFGSASSQTTPNVGSYGTQGTQNQGSYYQQNGNYNYQNPQGMSNTNYNPDTNMRSPTQANPGYQNQQNRMNNYRFPGTSDNYAPNNYYQNDYISDESRATTMDSDKRFAKDTASTPEDRQLNNQIRDKVSRGYLWDSYTDVILNTTDGIVTLSGSVRTDKDREKLSKEIEKIPGVKKVILALKIQDNK